MFAFDPPEPCQDLAAHCGGPGRAAGSNQDRPIAAVAGDGGRLAGDWPACDPPYFLRARPAAGPHAPLAQGHADPAVLDHKLRDPHAGEARDRSARRSGVSFQGVRFEKACEKTPRRTICRAGAQPLADQLDDAVADQFGDRAVAPRGDRRRGPGSASRMLPLGELGDRHGHFHAALGAAHPHRVLGGERDRHVFVIGIVVAGPRPAQRAGDVARELGKGEGAAVQVQPPDHVVDHRLVDLEAGQAVGRGLGPGRVAAQLVLGRQADPHDHPLRRGLGGDHRRLQGQRVQRS